MKKIIHYCWFGPKPLPKLAKKCIASWKKYMPDYEIKLWSEENIDLNECDFIKEAYENKKWAFVADYARTKVLYEYGGIYMDTDMELTKPLDDLMTEDFVIGVEDSGYIAAGLIIVKNKHNKYIKKMLDFYRNAKFNNIEDLFDISIPRVLTNIFKDDVDLSNTSKIIKIDGELAIYPREYFYPLSYDRKNNIFTENTYGIHYYDASWISPTSKMALWMNRNKLGFLVKYLYSIYNLFKNKNNLIISLVLSLLFVLSICNFTKYGETEVKITSLNDKNELSNSYNVVIDNIYSDDYVDDFKIKKLGYGWYNLNSRIKKKTDNESSIVLELPSANEHTIEFLKNGESSKIKIEYNDTEEIIDLYNENWENVPYGEEVFEYKIQSKTFNFFSIKNISKIIITFLIFVLLNLIWINIYQKNKKIIIFPVLLIYLTLFGFLGTFKVVNYDLISHMINIIFLIFASIYLSKNKVNLEKYFKHKYIFIVLLLLSTFIFVGHQLFMPGNYIIINIGIIGKFLLSTIYIGFIDIFLLTLYENNKDKLSDNKYNKKYVKIFYLIFFIIWLIALFAYFPANMTSDTADQWAQGLGLRDITSAHPPLLALYYRLLQKLGLGVFTAGLIQVIISSYIFGYITSYFYKKGVNFKFLVIFSVVIALLPCNYMLITTLWKDIYYTIFLLLTSFLIYRIYNEKDFFKLKNILVFSISLVIVYLTRHNGIGPLLFVSIYLVLYSIVKKTYKPLLIILVTFITIFLTNNVLYKKYVTYEESPYSDSMFSGIVTRTTASLLYNEREVKKEYLDIIETNYSKELLIKYFDKFNGDSYSFYEDANKYVYEHKEDDPITTDEAIKIYLWNLMHEPNLVIKERFDASSMLWATYMPDGSFNHRYADGIYFPDSLDGEIIGVKLENNQYQNNSILVKPFRLFMKITEKVVTLDSVTWRAGISWIIILLITFMLYANKRIKNILYLIPMLGNTATWIVVMAHQSYRYAWYINTIMCVYLLILIVNDKCKENN